MNYQCDHIFAQLFQQVMGKSLALFAPFQCRVSCQNTITFLPQARWLLRRIHGIKALYALAGIRFDLRRLFQPEDLVNQATFRTNLSECILPFHQKFERTR